MNSEKHTLFGIALFFCVMATLGIALYVYKQTTKQTGESSTTFVPTTDNSIFPPRSTTTDQGHLPTVTTTTPVFFTKRSIADATLERLETRWHENNQEYYVGTSTPSYIMEYSKILDSVSIYILQEPAGKARDMAETELKQALGMSEQEICDLKVYVTRDAPWLSDGYERVGLSFCPGSMPL